MAKIEFGMGFKLDKSGLVQAQSEIQKISKTLEKSTRLKVDGAELEKLKKDVEGFGNALDKAFDKDLGKINVNKLQSELKKANLSVDDFRQSLSRAGISGAEAFMGIQKEILRTGTAIKHTKGIVAEMSETIVRTAKWSVSTAAVNSFTGSIQKAVGYIKGMDDSLNNIRIVTGKSASEMKIFEESANKSAKALGKTTKEYADASLIFFQQGKTAAEVKELTEATLVGANITGESVSNMADYLTAALNGYTMEANKAMEVTDKLAAVGAATGSDFGELAIGMSKVASAANVMGVDIDQLSGMLATVTTVTREAPETIGTTFKTIFTRMSEMKAGKKDDEGWTTGKVEEALNMIDVSVLDEQNKLRDMGEVIEEVGSKWATLNKESKVGVATAMAGTRQSSRLIALFDNWAMYEDAVRVSQEANGAAMEQNSIRMDTIAAKSKQMRAEMEELYRSILSEDMFKGFYSLGTTVVGEINNVIDGFDGVKGLMLSLGGIATNVFSKEMAGGLDKVVGKVDDLMVRAKSFAKGGSQRGITVFEQAALDSVENARQLGPDKAGGMTNMMADANKKVVEDRIKLRQQEQVVAQFLTTEEQRQYQVVKDRLDTERTKLTLMKASRIEAEEEAKANLQAEKVFGDKPVNWENKRAMAEKEKAVSKEIEKQNKLYNQQYADLKTINDANISKYHSVEKISALYKKDVETLTKEEQAVRKIFEAHGLTERKVEELAHKRRANKKIIEEINAIEKKVNDTVEQTSDELERQEQIRRDLKVMAEQGASQEEQALENSVAEDERRAAAFERDARRLGAIQAGIQGIGVAMQGISALQTFKKLSDDTLTLEERTNTIVTGLGQISGFLMALIPLGSALATVMGGAAAATIGAILPWVAGAAAIAALGIGVVKLANHFNPLNKVMRENQKLLDEYAGRIDNLKNKQQGLKDASLQVAEAEKLAADGLLPEELEKYHALLNEAAERSPEMVAYYDAFGNAVMKSKDEVAKMNEELEKNMDMAHKAMSGNAVNFAEEAARTLSSGAGRKENIENRLGTAQDELRDLQAGDGSIKDINKKQEEIDSLLKQLNSVNEEIDGLQKRIQEGMIKPTIEGSETFKNMGKELQGYIGTIFNSSKVLEDLQNITSASEEERVSKSRLYAKQLIANLEEIGKGFADLNQKAIEGDEKAKVLVERLGALPQDIQESIGGQLLKIVPGIDEEQLKSEISNLSSFVNEEGEFLSFEFAKHLMDIAPQIKEGLANEIREALNMAFSNIDLEAGGGFLGLAETVGESLKSALAEVYSNSSTGIELKEQIGTLISDGTISTEEIGALKEILLSNTEALSLFRTALEERAESASGEKGEQLETLLEQIDLIYEKQEAEAAIEESLMNQDAFYSNMAATMAESIDGQAEIVELLNEATELTSSLGEGGILGIDLETAQENNDILEDSAELIASTVHEQERLAESSKQVGNAFEEMVKNMGEGSFEQILSLTNQTKENLLRLAQEAKNGNIDAARSLQNEMRKIYAGMNAEDTKYYNNFKNLNRDKLNVIDSFANTSADKHENLASYINDLEQHKAQIQEKYLIWQKQEVVKSLQERIGNESVAASKSVKIAGEVVSGEQRMSHISALLMARHAVTAAKAASDGGSEAAATVIDAMAKVDTGASNLLSGIAAEIRKKGMNLDEAIKHIDSLLQEAAGKGAGDTDPTNDLNLKDILDGFEMPNLDLTMPAPPPGRIPAPTYRPSGGNNDLGPDKGPSASGPSGGSGGGGGGGKKPGKGSGGKGSGGKGDSGKEEKEVEDLEWTADRYHDINIELKQQERILKDLKDQQKKLYGKELLDNLAKQKKALQEQQKILERKLEMQKEDLANQKAILAQQGVSFNVDGTISNYNQLLSQKLAYVNSLSGEAKEAAKEEFQKLVELMEAYEKLNLDTIQSTKDAIDKAIEEQREIFLKEFDYAINLKLEISEDFKKALDFMKDMNDEYEDMSDNHERTQKQIDEQVDLIKRLKDEIEKVRNDSTLTEKERLERLEKLTKELEKALKTLKNLDKEITKIFKDTISDGMKMVKEHLDDLKDINDQLDHYADILKLIGEEDNYELLDDIYDAQYDNIMARIDVVNKTLDALKEQAKQLEAAGMVGSEEWKKVQEEIQKTEKNLNSLGKTALQIAQKDFKNAIDETLSNLENGLTAGKGFKELKDMMKEAKEERKKYLDNEEKLLAVSKLQQKIQKAIDETDDPSKKKQLEKLKESELKKLKEKDKLTKYDVDRANQIYDLTMKQMALEDQRATKNMMRLVRDTQGNWVYEFTEDAAAIEKAQQDISSSYEKLMQMDKQQLEKTQEEMLKLQEEYFKEIQKITKEAAAGKFKTEEDFRKALEEVTIKFEEKGKKLNEEYLEAKTNATISSMGVMVNEYLTTGNVLEGMTESQKKLLEALAENTGNSFVDLEKTVAGLLVGDEESIKKAFESLGFTTEEEMGEAHDAVTGLVENMYTDWNTAIGDMLTAINKFETDNKAPVNLIKGTWAEGVKDIIAGFNGELGFKNQANIAIQDVVNKWGEYNDKVVDVQKQTGTSTEAIKNGIENAKKETEALKDKTDELITKITKEWEEVTKLTTAYNGNTDAIKNNREEVQKLIKDMLEYLDTINKIIDATKRENDTGDKNTNPTPPPAPEPTPPPTPPTPPSSGGSGGSGGSGQGNGTPEKGDVVTFHSGRYMYSSEGVRPTGYTLRGIENAVEIDMVSPLPASKAPYQYHLRGHGKYSAHRDLGWVKADQISGFDTGGYTGAWGSEGKLAMLHEKEIVLNKQDTGKILEAVQLVRGISGNALSSVADVIAQTSRQTISALGGLMTTINPRTKLSNSVDNGVQQNIEINADFSGVRSADEIEKAFENMANMASQYVSRK